jgi:hypothetical protein
MSNPHRRIRKRAWAALVWMLVFFLTGQLALGLYLHRRHPEFFDPEFTFRLRDLKARLAEAPDRPLALAIGSSRIACGLRPDCVRAPARSGEPEPLLFNLSLVGAGPVRQRMVLRRVLEAGIRPRWLFVEVWAPYLTQTGFYNEEAGIFKQDVYWPDVPVIARLYDRRWTAMGRVLTETLTPALHYRLRLLQRRARFLVPQSKQNSMQFEAIAWSNLDGWGWLPIPRDPGETAALLARDRALTQPLLDRFHVSAVSDQALRDLLDDCRVNDIRAVLLLMPEHSALRSWYPARTRSMLAAYLNPLSAAYRAPLIDASAWCADEGFGDCCHLQPPAARSFSERFGRDIYQPLLAGRPPAGDMLAPKARQASADAQKD